MFRKSGDIENIGGSYVRYQLLFQKIKSFARLLGNLKRLPLPRRLHLYDELAMSLFTGNVPAPRSYLGASWAPGTPYYQRVVTAMMEAEFDYARDLLRWIDDDGLPGAVIEFGVFEGMWLSVLAEYYDGQERKRQIYGLDSFQGLPSPDAENDLACFAQGQYAAAIESVALRLKTDRRPNLHLVKGWFSESLSTARMRDIGQIAYARIDCDLYQPTVECLAYLTDRLVDGAILVFDDWTYDFEKGETKAFLEWTRGGGASGLGFEFLAYGVNGHFYLRVSRSRNNAAL